MTEARTEDLAHLFGLRDGWCKCLWLSSPLTEPRKLTRDEAAQLKRSTEAASPRVHPSWMLSPGTSPGHATLSYRLHGACTTWDLKTRDATGTLRAEGTTQHKRPLTPGEALQLASRGGDLARASVEWVLFPNSDDHQSVTVFQYVRQTRRAMAKLRVVSDITLRKRSVADLSPASLRQLAPVF